MNIRILWCVLALASVVFLTGFAEAQGPRYTDWSALEPVTVVNTTGPELAPGISHDGLRLYFMRAGDIYVSHRADQRSDWEAPVALPSTINKPAPIIDSAPFESTNGHWLFFISTRSGGVGDFDIWVSYRRFVHSDDAWQEPVNLSAVNSVGFEGGPTLFEDDATGVTQLYFAAAPYAGGTQGVADLYVSNLGPNGFETPVAIVELNSAAHDGRSWVRRDGHEIFFESYREGLPAPFTFGSVYSSTRPSTDQSWSDPTIAVGRTTAGNPGDRWITTPSLSRDGLTLYVAANQPGSDFGDIFVAHRERVTGRR